MGGWRGGGPRFDSFCGGASRTRPGLHFHLCHLLLIKPTEEGRASGRMRVQTKRPGGAQADPSLLVDGSAVRSVSWSGPGSIPVLWGLTRRTVEETYFFF